MISTMLGRWDMFTSFNSVRSCVACHRDYPISSSAAVAVVLPRIRRWEGSALSQSVLATRAAERQMAPGYQDETPLYRKPDPDRSGNKTPYRRPTDSAGRRLPRQGGCSTPDMAHVV